MSEFDTKINITAEEEVSGVVDRVVESLGDNKLGSALTAASTGFLALKEVASIAMEAMHKVVEVMAETVEAAAAAEQADKQLATALALAGRSAETSATQIEEFSTALGETQGISGETSKGMIALGVSYGMAASQAMEATKAALDYAAATGVDANTAMRQFSMTLSGNLGRMGMLIPQLKYLTETQLRNGEAVAIIAERYRGMADEMAGTFSGSVKVSREGLQQLMEALGDFIVKNEFVREGIKAVGEALFGAAKFVREMQTWIKDNAQTIKEWAEVIAIASVAVLAYQVAMNATAIAAGIATVAQWALNVAVAANPIGLAILAVAGLAAGLKYLGVGIDEVVAAFKIWIGVAIMPATLSLGLLTQGVAMLVSVFDKDLAASIDAVGVKIRDAGTGMVKTGAQTLYYGKATMDAVAANGQLTTATAESMAAVKKQQEELRRATLEFGKLQEAAKPAYDALKELTPQVQLGEWKKTSAEYLGTLQALRSASKDIIVKIGTTGGANKADQAVLAAAHAEEIKAVEAIGALKIKDAMQVRDIRTKAAQQALDYERQQTIALVDDLFLKRTQAAEQIRSQQVAIATQRAIAEEGIEIHLVTVAQQARAGARQQEVAAYKEMLDTQLALAVDSETQKQGALVAMRSQAVSGLGGMAEGGAKEDATVQREQERQAQLQALRDAQAMDNQAQYDAQAISKEEFDQRMLDADTQFYDNLAASRSAQTMAGLEQEKAMADERAQVLGLTEEGLQARLDAAQAEYDMRLEKLALAMETETITAQEYTLALEAAEQDSFARRRDVQNTFNTEMIASDQVTWASISATRSKFFADQASQQAKSVNEFMSGVGAMKAAQAGLQTTFASVGDAMIKNQSISAKKMTGMFLEAFGRQVQQKGFGDIVMAIFPPNPVQAAAGTAEVALGTAIGRLGASMQKEGGQADSGLTRVPESLSGRTFILNAGERVVAGEQNRDLSAALDKINGGGAGGGNTVNVTVNGNPDRDQLRTLRDTIIDGIREASERGTPIISQKGVVPA